MHQHPPGILKINVGRGQEAHPTRQAYFLVQQAHPQQTHLVQRRATRPVRTDINRIGATGEQTETLSNHALSDTQFKRLLDIVGTGEDDTQLMSDKSFISVNHE